MALSQVLFTIEELRITPYIRYSNDKCYELGKGPCWRETGAHNYVNFSVLGFCYLEPLSEYLADDRGDF